MIEPGTVVVADFPGATGLKRRPCVVISSDSYHRTRPDVILGLVTSQLAGAVEPSDYVLTEWKSAGLRKPSAFRSFLFTLPRASVNSIGRLSDRDWQGVQSAVANAIGAFNEV